MPIGILSSLISGVLYIMSSFVSIFLKNIQSFCSNKDQYIFYNSLKFQFCCSGCPAKNIGGLTSQVCDLVPRLILLLKTWILYILECSYVTTSVYKYVCLHRCYIVRILYWDRLFLLSYLGSSPVIYRRLFSRFLSKYE